MGLEGYMNMELGDSRGSVEKFWFEASIKLIYNIRKVYIIGVILAVSILPNNLNIELRTEIEIINWLIEFEKLNTVRRELDDKFYICELYCVRNEESTVSF